MTRTSRASLTIAIATPVAAVSVACVCLVLAASAAGAEEHSEAGVHFTQESMQAYEQQLAAGQIKSVSFRRKVLSMHLTLKDGRRVHVSYPPHGEVKLVAELKAKGVPARAVKNTASHKRRYIAAGIAIVVVIAVVVALLVRRRRRREEE